MVGIEGRNPHLPWLCSPACFLHQKAPQLSSILIFSAVLSGPLFIPELFNQWGHFFLIHPLYITHVAHIILALPTEGLMCDAKM